MKTAYQRALELLQQQGIEPPRDEAYTAEVIAEMDAVRARSTAKIAELEILFRNELKTAADAAARAAREQEYQRDRARLEAERERQLERIRQRAGAP